MVSREGFPRQLPSEDAPTAKRLRGDAPTSPRTIYSTAQSQGAGPGPEALLAGTPPGSPSAAAAGVPGQGQGPAMDVRKVLVDMKLSAKEVFAGKGSGCLPPFASEERLGALLQQLWVWAVQQGKVPADAPIDQPLLVMVAQWGLQRMREGAVQGKDEKAQGSGAFGGDQKVEAAAAQKGRGEQEQKAGPSGEEAAAGVAAAAQVPQLHLTVDQVPAAAAGLEPCEAAFEISLNPQAHPVLAREASLSPTVGQEISLSPGGLAPCLRGRDAEQARGSGGSVQAAAAGPEAQWPGNVSLGQQQQQQRSVERRAASPRAMGSQDTAVSPAAAAVLAKWISTRKASQGATEQGGQGPQQVEDERELSQQQQQQQQSVVQRPQPVRPALSAASLQRASGSQPLTGYLQQLPKVLLPLQGDHSSKASAQPESVMTLPPLLRATPVEQQHQQQKDILYLLGDLTAAELGAHPSFTSTLQEVLCSFDTGLAARGIAFQYTPAELRQACSFVVRQVDSEQKQWLAQDAEEFFYVVLQACGLVQHMGQKVQELHESIGRKVARIAAAAGREGAVAGGDSLAGAGKGAAAWGSMSGLLFGDGDALRLGLGASSSRPVQPGEVLRSYGSWEQHLTALQASGYGQAAAADSREGQVQDPGSDLSIRAGSGNASRDGGRGSAAGNGSAQQQQTASELAAQLLEIMRAQLQAKEGCPSKSGGEL